MRHRSMAMVVKNGRILMIKICVGDCNFYTIPGGGIDNNETPEQTAIRELKEECGLDGVIVRKLTENHGKNGNIEYVFLVDVNGGQLPIVGTDLELPLDKQCIKEVRWMRLSELSERDRAFLWSYGLMETEGFEQRVYEISNIEIYEATDNDIPAVAQMAAIMWDSHTVEDLSRTFTEIIGGEDSAVFVAKADNRSVGFAQCSLRYDYVEGTHSNPVGYLEGIFVIPQYRNRGCAKQLLNGCEEWAREKGCSEFASDCELNNNISLEFHLKMGFTEANRIICFTKQL